MTEHDRQRHCLGRSERAGHGQLVRAQVALGEGFTTLPWSREFSAASPGPRFRLTRSRGPRAATMKERREASSEVGPCHARREAGICITLVLSAMYDTSTGSIHAGAGYRQPAEQGTECIFRHPSQWLAGIHVSRWANGQSFNQFVARCKMVQGERHPSRRGELPCSDDVDDVVHDLQSIAIRRRPADVRWRSSTSPE